MEPDEYDDEEELTSGNGSNGHMEAIRGLRERLREQREESKERASQLEADIAELQAHQERFRRLVWLGSIVFTAFAAVGLAMLPIYVERLTDAPAPAVASSSSQSRPGMMVRMLDALPSYPDDRQNPTYWTRDGRPTLRGLEAHMGLPRGYLTGMAWVRDGAMDALREQAASP